MLTKEQYKELSKNWSKHGTVYQKYDRYQVRFPMLLKHIDVFKDKDVLEVGSNAGLAAYHIAQVAKSYTGVEGEKGYWNQSLETQKQIESKNTDFKNMSIKTYIKRAARGDFEINVNAAYLSYVLYHFSDKEVSMFEKNILPKLDVIVVQSRYENRNKKGRTAHNSYKFWMPKSVEKYLIKNGFSTTVEYGPRNKFHFIIGRKSYSDEETIKQQDDMIHEALIEKIVDVAKKEGKVEYRGSPTKITKEQTDGDQGSSGVHTEGEYISAEGQRTPDRRKGKTKRISQSTPKRKVDPKGEGQTVLPKRRRGRRPSVLLDGVEKSSKDKVRSKDVQKTKQTSRSRAVSTSRKDNKSKNKSAVQEHEAQS